MADQPRYNRTRNAYIYGPGPAGDTLEAASGAIAHVDGTHAITKAGVAVMTLSVPTAAEEGMRIYIVSRTANAHTVTVAGGLGGNAADDVITFNKVGGGIELQADNLFWVPVGAGYDVVIS